jgi:MFS family permease
MTFVAIPSLIGPMLGPVAGGLIVDYLHWRAIFFVNIPIGLAGLNLIWRNLPDYSAPDAHRLDWVGLILFSSGVALLSYVLEVFGEHTLSAREMLALLGIALALLAAYGGHALGVAHPAAADRRDEFESVNAAHPAAPRLSTRAAVQYGVDRLVDHPAFHHRSRHTGVATASLAAALIFNGLTSDDGSSISQRRVEVPTI